jgi:micrococcal nuclease
MYEYNSIIRYVVDGDTVDVDIDLGFGVWLRDQRIRLYGIDTPESRTRDLTEKLFGFAAKDFVKNYLPVGSKQILKTFIGKDGEDMRGKFGRILGDFFINDGKMLVKTMITEGYGVAYNGQSKTVIQEAHLKNRQLLISKGIVKI